MLMSDYNGFALQYINAFHYILKKLLRFKEKHGIISFVRVLKRR